MRNDFALFIISHNNPDCETLQSLQSANYTGKLYVVVDTLDPSLSEYEVGPYGLCVFDKYTYLDKVDIGMSRYSPQMSVALYARAAVEDFARDLNLKYFAVLDDDIVGFRLRYPNENKLVSVPIRDIDSVFNLYLNYMSSTPIGCLSFANDGSFIGGISAFDNVVNKRVCYTVFIRKTSESVDWAFAVNEDHITSLQLSSRGFVLFTLPFVQRAIKGMNDRDVNGSAFMYQTTSEFERAFYATVARPDICIPTLYKNHFIIKTKKQYAFPKILSSRYKKGDTYATI